jgi:hypothetical protein
MEKDKFVAGSRWVPDTKTDWPTDCRSKYNFEFDFSHPRSPCGGRLKYLYRSPASRKGRRKGNLMPGGITGPPCSWGT